MQVKVKPLCSQGRVLRRAEHDKQPGFVGDLSVAETRDQGLGRHVVRARLLSLSSSPQTEVLPELLDARLLWAADKKLRLTGFERIDETEYLQTWAVEVV